MPGIPGVYYGSEFGIEGDKSHGDDALRTMFDLDKFKAEGICDVTELLTKLCKLRNESKALAYGSFANLQLTNRQYSFRRDADGETIVTLLNADENGFDFNLNIGGEFVDILTGNKVDLSAPVHIDGCKAIVAVSI